MKIGVFGIESLTHGKENINDERLDVLKKMFTSAKKVCIQAEIVTDKEALKEADGIVAPEGHKADLILEDLEFVEIRLERSADEVEKRLLTRFKEQLDKEAFLSGLALSEEDKKLIAGYPLLTVKPVYLAKPEEIEDKSKLLLQAYNNLGYISFFTAGEKDAHAWALKKGLNAWDAAGCIHSDIQKGFIRAEVIAYDDLVKDGGFNQARNNNHLRLENKEYIVNDGDWMVFRFNK
ncbi:MAG: DUF933 domain-containing protein [Candidatus Omnitrophica bacterium]|nr:DUF933 domain-containing protein [Candidatus Omnitrophota bacterium]